MTTDTLAKLAACPFCGKSHTLKISLASEVFGVEDEPYMHSEAYAVTCDASRPDGPGGCGASGGYKPTEAEAIEAWNRRALTAQAPAPKLSDKLQTLLKCIPDAPFKQHLTAEIEALAAQALPAAEPTKLDVMPIFWKCFRRFPSTAGALTHTVWKDGIDIDKLSAPMQRFCDELVQAAQQAAQAPAGWQPIETAPKDGTEILLFADGRLTYGKWSTPSALPHLVYQDGFAPEQVWDEWEPYWESYDGGFTEEHPPTHWMPPHQPPQPQEDA